MIQELSTYARDIHQVEDLGQAEEMTNPINLHKMKDDGIYLEVAVLFDENVFKMDE